MNEMMRLDIFQKQIIRFLFLVTVSVAISSCKVSVTSGEIKDTFASDVREDPIPEQYASELFAYADSVIADLYKKDISALREKSHPDYSDMFNKVGAGSIMKLLNAEKVNQSSKEYLGYNMYQTKDELVFASLFYRVPNENGGNDNITLNIDADMNDCCRLVGFHVEKFFKKSFLGKK